MLANRPAGRRPASLLLVVLAATCLTCALIAPATGAAGASPRGVGAALTPAADCQLFGQAACLLPFPNNLFTKRDRSTATRKCHCFGFCETNSNLREQSMAVVLECAAPAQCM